MFNSGVMKLGTAAPTSFSAGVGYDAGILAVDSVNAIAYYSGGLPFTAAGRLCVAVGGAADRVAANVPFTTAGRIAVYAAQPTLGEEWLLANSLVGSNGTSMAFSRASTQDYQNIYGSDLTAATNVAALTGAAIVLQGAHDAEALTDLQVSTVGMPVNDCAYYFELPEGVIDSGSNMYLFESRPSTTNFFQVIFISSSNELLYRKKTAGTQYDVRVPYTGGPVKCLLKNSSTAGMSIETSEGEFDDDNNTSNLTFSSIIQVGNNEALTLPLFAPMAKFKYFTDDDITLAEASNDLEGHDYTSSGTPFSAQSQIVANVVQS